MSENEDETAYEIGLVMAGAVSAGAYSAGVLDFLIQALEEWYTAKKERPEEVPDHDVRVKVMAGSSAGGMTGAIGAGAFGGEHAPVTSLPGNEPSVDVVQSNNLYSAWVDKIDIRPLLEAEDQSGDGPLTSLLDSSILNEIAETALDPPSNETEREYVADPMHLLLVLTNLKGVPYDITFEGNADVSHRTTRHTDYKEFVVSQSEPEGDSGSWLDPGTPTSPQWDALRQYALATGAFPGVLAPRGLTRARADYNRRDWDVPLRPDEEDARQCSERVPIQPSWPEDVRDDKEYRFLAVDGGAMNNEPFELARRRLAGEEEANPRSAAAVTRSVLMVDPLPSREPPDQAEEQDQDVLSVLGALFGSLLAEARFKPDELMLARSETVYSRYMIVPTRRDENDEKVAHPIASEMVRGFGGFLKRQFRVHDFQLGRRNCQQFLRKHFCIPKEECTDNPVFSHYDSRELDRFSFSPEKLDYDESEIQKYLEKYFEVPNGIDTYTEGYFGESKQDWGESDLSKYASGELDCISDERNRFADLNDEMMPIIPLIGSAKSEEFPLKWRTLQMRDQKLKELRSAFENRTKLVLENLLSQYIPGFAAKMAASWKKGDVVDRIMDRITSGLEEYDLRA